jgi:hypothetical protein
MRINTKFIRALIAQILFPLDVSIINFKINSKVLVCFNIKLGISFKEFSCIRAISFQCTILDWTLFLTNDIHEETFPVTNIMRLNILTSVDILENAWILSISFGSSLDWLLAADLLLLYSHLKVCLFNTIWALNTKLSVIRGSIGCISIKQHIAMNFCFFINKLISVHKSTHVWILTIFLVNNTCFNRTVSRMFVFE